MDIEFNNIQICLDEYSLRFIEVLKTKMQTKDSRGYNRVASGKLLASLGTVVKQPNETRFEVYLRHKDYLKYLEYGTRPHYPPFAPLLAWVREKGLPTREKTGDRKLPTDKQMAYLVQQKIGREGTTGLPLVKNTEDQLNPEFEERIAEALAKDVERFVTAPTMQINLIFK